MRRPRATRPHVDGMRLLGSGAAGGDHGLGPLVPALRPTYRDVEEQLAERGVEVDHVTVYRRVQRFTPLFADAARR